MIFHLKIDFTFITLYIYRGTLMKKLIFGIALILFGFSMAYLSAQAQWAIMQAVSRPYRCWPYLPGCCSQFGD